MDTNPTDGVFSLAKHDESLKLEIVQAYLAGPIGYKALAKQYEVVPSARLASKGTSASASSSGRRARHQFAKALTWSRAACGSPPLWPSLAWIHGGRGA
ncbi:hypothetical protein [Roseateles sp. DC23W]|uniref:hypothetical protein n=1 Tax=Pelomonas dachongensis TaxID=3299029 RepID=UPI0037479B77